MEVCQGFKQRYSNAVTGEVTFSNAPAKTNCMLWTRCGSPKSFRYGYPAARITSVRRAFKSLMQLAVCSRTSLTGWAGCQRPGTAKLTQLILVGGAMVIWVRQWEGLSHILWKIKNVWNHQPEYYPVGPPGLDRYHIYIYYYGKIKNVPNHQPGLMSYLFLRRLLGDLWAANSYLTVVLYLYTVPIMFETQNFIIMLVP